MEFKPYSVTDPKAIKIIRYALQRKDLTADVAKSLSEEIIYTSDPKNMSSLIASNGYNDSYLSYIYSGDAPENSDVKQKYDRLTSIYSEKTGVTDFSKVKK